MQGILDSNVNHDVGGDTDSCGRARAGRTKDETEDVAHRPSRLAFATDCRLSVNIVSHRSNPLGDGRECVTLFDNILNIG